MDIGKTYFFTATVLKWKPIFQNSLLVDIVLDSLKHLVKNNDILLHGYVIMPNHIHLIWTPLTKNVQLRFMKFTSQQIKFHLNDNSPLLLEYFLVKKKDRVYQIWKRNPLAVELFSRKVVEQKLAYIHNNPVQGKWLLAHSPLEYTYSSARFYELGEANELLSHYFDRL